MGFPGVSILSAVGVPTPFLILGLSVAIALNLNHVITSKRTGLVGWLSHVLNMVCIANLALGADCIMAVSYLFVHPFSRKLYRRLNSYVAQALWVEATAAVLSPAEIVVTGEMPDADTQAIVIANHQVDADWWYIWEVMRRLNRHGAMKIILKEGTQNVPVIGWGMRGFEFIFLKRDWAQDRENLQRQLSLFMEDSFPLRLLIFPEGTTCNTRTMDKCVAYAKKESRPSFQHLLLPRTMGFKTCVEAFAAGWANGRDGSRSPFKHLPAGVAIMPLSIPGLASAAGNSPRAGRPASAAASGGHRGEERGLGVSSSSSSSSSSGVAAGSADGGKKVSDSLHSKDGPAVDGKGKGGEEEGEGEGEAEGEGASEPVVYDLTIAYTGYSGEIPPWELGFERSVDVGVPNVRKLLRGQRMGPVHIHCEKHSLTHVQAGGDRWLDAAWARKDALLKEFLVHGRFPHQPAMVFTAAQQPLSFCILSALPLAVYWLLQGAAADLLQRLAAANKVS